MGRNRKDVKKIEVNRDNPYVTDADRRALELQYPFLKEFQHINPHAYRQKHRIHPHNVRA